MERAIQTFTKVFGHGWLWKRTVQRNGGAQRIDHDTAVFAARRRNMTPNSWADEYDLRLYRKRIETVYSQMEAMGVQHLHACTHHGLNLKAYASLLALAFTNIIPV